MKFIILLFIISQSLLAVSINPKKIHHNLFKVYSNYKIIKNYVNLPGIKFLGKKAIDEGVKLRVPLRFYNKARLLSRSILEVDSSAGKGSAVHVGGNLLLTNLHVLSAQKNERLKRCSASFKSYGINSSGVTLKCKKIHVCSKALDFCLVEAFDSRAKKSLKDILAPKFNDHYDPINKNKVEMIAIGNTQGFGIHASSGYGLNNYNASLTRYYAGTLKGNSGGGLFNMDGELVGLVVAQSKQQYGPRAFNVAIKLESIKSFLQKSSIDSEVLNQIAW